MSSYRDLDIYNIAFELAIEVHHLTLKLPSYELYEQGSQIRRAAQRIKDTIAEGYGRKRYKNEFIRYLDFAHASCDETISHLSMLNTLYFQNEGLNELIVKYNELGAKINNFTAYVEKQWKSPK